MNYIKTCYGEWINPALVKHFGIEFENGSNKNCWLAVADGVVIQKFEIEDPPYDKNIWKVNRYDETDEDRAKQKEWEKARDINRQQARAKACAWLAELVANLAELVAKFT